MLRARFLQVTRCVTSTRPAGFHAAHFSNNRSEFSWFASPPIFGYALTTFDTARIDDNDGERPARASVSFDDLLS